MRQGIVVPHRKEIRTEDLYPLAGCRPFICDRPKMFHYFCRWPTNARNIGYSDNGCLPEFCFKMLVVALVYCRFITEPVKKRTKKCQLCADAAAADTGAVFFKKLREINIDFHLILLRRN